MSSPSREHPLTIPDGFEQTRSRGKFTNHNGPVYVATAENDLRSGLFVLDRHCNSMGFLHGGMTSAFADRALAIAVWSVGERASVTLKLTVHYYETVRLGDWLEAHPEILSVDGDLVQVGADMKIRGERLAARANATFRLLRRTKKHS